MVLRHLLFWLLLPYTLCIFLLSIKLLGVLQGRDPSTIFPITFPKILHSGVVCVQTFALRSCPSHLALARIHFGYQNAVTLFPFRDADFFENYPTVEILKFITFFVTNLNSQNLVETFEFVYRLMLRI